MKELVQYFDAYAEDALTGDDVAQFSAWLHQDDSHVAEFAREAFLHWNLAAIGQRRGMQSDVLDSTPQLTHPLKTPSSKHQLVAEARAGQRLWKRVRLPAAVAATVLAVAAWLLFGQSRPTIVAQISKSSPGVRFLNGDVTPAGSFLPAGKVLAIEDGRLLTTLESGVQILLDGPTELRLDSAMKAYLSRGQVTVSVPREASGFLVETSAAKFLDLGTEYALSIERDTSCSLQVFKGLVEINPVSTPGGGAAGPLRIPEGRAINYDFRSGKVTTLPYDPNARMSL